MIRFKQGVRTLECWVPSTTRSFSHVGIQASPGRGTPPFLHPSAAAFGRPPFSAFREAVTCMQKRAWVVIVGAPAPGTAITARHRGTLLSAPPSCAQLDPSLLHLFSTLTPFTPKTNSKIARSVLRVSTY